MGLAGDVEAAHHRVAEHDRAVDQGVEVLGAVGVRLSGDWQQRRRRALPGRRQLHPHLVRPRRPIGQRDEGGRAVQHREAGLDPVGAHRHLAAVDAVAHGDRAGAAGLDPPAVLRRLHRRQRPAVGRLRAHGLDMPLVLAHQVRPRRPHRHHQIDLRPPARGIDRLDLEVMGVRGREAEGVANRLGTLGGRCRPSSETGTARRTAYGTATHGRYCRRAVGPGTGAGTG